MQLMQHVIGQHQIYQRIYVDIGTEVFIVVATKPLAHTVRMVQHRSDAVEAESVERVLDDPPT
jgi:hypothetical protein